MCLAQGPQHSEAGKAGTHSLLVSSQALYHWATALPGGNSIMDRRMYKQYGVYFFVACFWGFFFLKKKRVDKINCLLNFFPNYS